MRRNLTFYIIAIVIALISLSLSQGIWFGNVVRQAHEQKSAKLKERFDKALSYSIFSTDLDKPLISIEPLDSIPEEIKSRPEKIIDLGKTNNYGNVGGMIENALLLNRIKSGRMSLVYLDSLIQDRSKDLGKIMSSRLTLYDANNIAIDSAARPLPFLLYF